MDLAETSKSFVFFFVEVTAVVAPSSRPIESCVEHELRDQAGPKPGDECDGEGKDGTQNAEEHAHEEMRGGLVLASSPLPEGVDAISNEADHGERGGQEKCGLKDLEEQF